MAPRGVFPSEPRETNVCDRKKAKEIYLKTPIAGRNLAVCNLFSQGLFTSFARIFFRNSVATGELYPCECVDRLCDVLKTGDVVAVDLDAGTVTVKESGKVYRFKPLGDVRPVVDAGGLFNYARKTGMISK